MIRNFDDFLDDFLLTVLFPQIEDRIEDYLQIYIHGNFSKLKFKELMLFRLKSIQLYLDIL